MPQRTIDHREPAQLHGAHFLQVRHGCEPRASREAAHAGQYDTARALAVQLARAICRRIASGTAYAIQLPWARWACTPMEEQMFAPLMPRTMRRRHRSSIVAAPTIGVFMTGAVAGGVAALLLTPQSGRDLRKRLRSAVQGWGERTRDRRIGAATKTSRRRGDQSGQQLRSKVGTEASRVLSGDLPGSVGGLSAGATPDLAGDDTSISGEDLGR